MISRVEIDEWAKRFGVAAPQIARDHFISHVLAALGASQPDVRFSGGTALCRTYLEGSRLSEDVDLLHQDPRALLATLAEELPQHLRREFPGTAWTHLPPEGDGLSGLLSPPDLSAIKVYVGRDGANTRGWEFVATDVQLRYRDLPATRTLRCPTLATFAAMKLAAWFDRHAPRDLFDLTGLAALGVLADPEVGRILKAQTGVGVIGVEFSRAPSATVDAWETELAAQVGFLPDIDTCLRAVHAALAE
jgi:hypothetical protein